jgi:RecG-like helicase
MIVGTHAIFQEQVQFNGLALVIIDEQHRFGVHQRLALWEKGQQQGFHPHQLIMTATPIPRTLAMTAYADLDTFIIDCRRAERRSPRSPSRIPGAAILLTACATPALTKGARPTGSVR